MLRPNYFTTEHQIGSPEVPIIVWNRFREQKGEKNTSLCVKMVSLGRSDLDQYTIQFQTPHALMGWDEIHCGAWYTSLTYHTHQTYQVQKSHP